MKDYNDVNILIKRFKSSHACHYYLKYDTAFINLNNREAFPVH